MAVRSSQSKVNGQRSAVRILERGTLEPGTWNLEPGTWNLKPGTHHLNSLTMSFPLAKTRIPRRMIMPAIWAYSINLSLGFRPLIIS